jgi:DNA-binding HxlR family transcriptional regulator
VWAGRDEACPPCPDVFSAQCLSRRALELTADKWSVLVLGALMQRTHRHAELLRRIDRISQKMLTQTLRDLEHNHLVCREVFAEVPPRVEYSLTGLGETLRQPVMTLTAWAQDHIDQIFEQGASATV